MSASLLSSVGDAISLVLQALLALLVLGLVALIASASVRSRYALQFEPWTEFNSDARDDGNAEGQQVAELLLAEIREIQSVHQRSKRGLDLDNPYYDVPAFQQDLDDDLTLIASVQPQGHGQLVGELASVLLALVPVRPGRLQGSIHRSGGTVTLVANIDNLRYRTPKVRQWRVTGEVSAGDDLQPLICELAYKVYLELATSSAFNDSEAFRSYTHAVGEHLAFGEDERNKAAFREATRCYKRARKLEPTNPAVLYNLGVFNYYLYKAEPNKQAIGLFRSALRSADGHLKAQVHSGLCNALLQSYHRFDGDRDLLDKARSHAKRALAIDRDLDVALKALAFAYHESSEALVRYGPEKDGREALVRHDPDTHGRAHRRRIRRHRSRAIHLYRRTTRANPSYYVAYNNLANLYLNWAIDDCRSNKHLVVLAEKLPRKSIEMMTKRKKKQLLYLAEKLALKSIEIKPSYWHAYDNVGNAYRALGTIGEMSRFDEAKHYYEDARGLRKDYLAARHDLALLHLCSDWTGRDYREARRLHDETLDEDLTDKARDRYKDAFVRAATAARLDEPDLQGTTLRSVLPDDLRQRVTAAEQRTGSTPESATVA